MKFYLIIVFSVNIQMYFRQFYRQSAYELSHQQNYIIETKIKYFLYKYYKLAKKLTQIAEKALSSQSKMGKFHLHSI